MNQELKYTRPKTPLHAIEEIISCDSSFSSSSMQFYGIIPLIVVSKQSPTIDCVVWCSENVFFLLFSIWLAVPLRIERYFHCFIYRHMMNMIFLLCLLMLDVKHEMCEFGVTFGTRTQLKCVIFEFSIAEYYMKRDLLSHHHHHYHYFYAIYHYTTHSTHTYT